MRSYHQKRNGFAMIMAIFFMIVIATLLTYMLASTTETAKRTTNTYVNEQAQLLAKSAVEYTILRVSGFDRSGGNCMNGYTAVYPDTTNPIFDINVTVSYIGLGPLTGTCTDYIANISTPESNGTMLIDVYVTSTTGTNGLNLSEPIRYHRRTLQKL